MQLTRHLGSSSDVNHRPEILRELEDDCRAVIQVYNRALIRNRMSLP